MEKKFIIPIELEIGEDFFDISYQKQKKRSLKQLENS